MAGHYDMGEDEDEGQDAMGQGLQGLYDNGYPPHSQDELILELGGLTVEDSPILSLSLIQRIHHASQQLQANNDYPVDVKDALVDLSRQIKLQQRAVRARAEGRNLLSAATAGILKSRNQPFRRAMPTGSALNKLRNQPWFTGRITQLLSGAPRAANQGKGRIDPAMRNLKRMAEGKEPFRLLPPGRGTRREPQNRTGHRAGPRSGPGRGSRRGGRRTRRKRA